MQIIFSSRARTLSLTEEYQPSSRPEPRATLSLYLYSSQAIVVFKVVPMSFKCTTEGRKARTIYSRLDACM